MIHLQVMAPPDRTARVLEVLDGSSTATNVVVLRGGGRRPKGDVVFLDVARDEASDIISDLRDLGIERDGSIVIGSSETDPSSVDRESREPEGVVWEEVEKQTYESAELSGSFLVFAVNAILIAAVGIYLDSPILLVGAMIVGPDFGPIAGVCVAAVNRQPRQAGRSLLALAVGYGLGIAAAYLMTVFLREAGLIPRSFGPMDRAMGSLVAEPAFFAVLVALLAGIAGMLSLTTAKSGALIGVLVSVTTVPSAAGVGVAAAYAQWEPFRASAFQLATNVGAMLAAGTVTLAVQSALHRRQRAAHLRGLARREPREDVSATDQPPSTPTSPRRGRRGRRGPEVR